MHEVCQQPALCGAATAVGDVFSPARSWPGQFTGAAVQLQPRASQLRPRNQAAARVSDYTGFMLLGVLKEFGTTRQIFTNLKEPDTENYISGHFG